MFDVTQGGILKETAQAGGAGRVMGVHMCIING